MKLCRRMAKSHLANVGDRSIVRGEAPSQLGRPPLWHATEPRLASIYESYLLQQTGIFQGSFALANQDAATAQPAEIPIIPWPQQGPLLVDKRRGCGAFTKAFPTLFPRGREDTTSMSKKGAHHRFRHYLFNRVQREKASHTGTVFHKHYSGDGVSTFDDLKVLLRGGERTISSRLEGWSQNLRGTAAWKKDRRGELRDMIATLGLPTLFVTLSAADLHWHFLHDAITSTLEQALQVVTVAQRVQCNVS